MRILHVAVAAAVAGSAAVGVSRGPAAASVGAVMLAPGDPAPRFAMKGSDGRTHRLADYLGKQAVVLAWFAKAFTGG